MAQQSTEQRWNTVDALVARWRLSRQDLLVQYCQASDALDGDDISSHAKTCLRDFCQLLVDYASAGHFEVYHQLLLEAETYQDGGAETAKVLLPQIVASTEAATEFNDKYATGDGETGTLIKNLSKLGEILETRFELEDQLIDVLHEAHRVPTA